MKRKSIITLLLSVLLIAVVLVGGTLAYLVAEGDLVINSFALAEVKTDIEEPEENDNARAKTPYVKSTGSSKVYVRARAVVVTGEGSSVPVTEADMTIRYNDEMTFATGKFGPQQNAWWKDTDAYWKLESDGWYYYTVPLEKDERTEPLFDGVEVTTNWDNPESVKFDIYVYHESVLASADENGPAAFGE